MIVETYDSYFEGVCELDVSQRLLFTWFRMSSVAKKLC